MLSPEVIAAINKEIVKYHGIVSRKHEAEYMDGFVDIFMHENEISDNDRAVLEHILSSSSKIDGEFAWQCYYDLIVLAPSSD